MQSQKLPQVVVVMPFYNGAKWVERAIKSVVGQTLPPSEIIVVNDGSEATEREFLGKLAERYSFRIIDQKNGGQGSARNTGVSSSQAEHICFLDQDDYYLPRHIEDLVEAMPDKDPMLGFVYGDFCSADLEGRIINSNSLAFEQPDRHPKRGHIRHFISDDMFVLPSASIIRRSAFEAVGGFDVQFKGYEDDDLFLRMIRAGYTNYFLNKSVYVWCMHGGSTSWSISMVRSRFLYFKKLANSYPDDNHNRLYYLRDCIAPRFGTVFLQEAIKARFGLTKYPDEIMDMFNQYVEVVAGNPHIHKRAKQRLAYAAKVVNTYPTFLFRMSKLVRRAARKL
jgi:glycosyltransferase involved in cell wall biosynthesis